MVLEVILVVLGVVLVVLGGSKLSLLMKVVLLKGPEVYFDSQPIPRPGQKRKPIEFDMPEPTAGVPEAENNEKRQKNMKKRTSWDLLFPSRGYIPGGGPGGAPGGGPRGGPRDCWAPSGLQ